MEQDIQDEKDTEAPRKRPLLVYVIIAFFLILIPIVLLIVSIYRESTGFKPNNLVETIDYFRASYVPDQLIVKLKNEYTEQELQNLKSKFEELGVTGQQKAYKSNKEYLKDYYLLQFKPGTDLRRVKEELDKTGVTVESHPNYIFKIQASTPNDPLYSQQWDLAKIDMPDAWTLAHGSNNVKVAIIDTGIDYNHPDFVGRTIIKGSNYTTCPNTERDRNGFCLVPPGIDPLDDHGHGTHVAGTIGAVTNNSQGTAGINWNVSLIAIKSQDGQGSGEMSDVISGMVYAIDHGANVINMSLVSEGVLRCSTVPELQSTVNDGINQRIIMVIAAGNDNQDANNVSPPSCRGVIVVGATDQNDKRWIGQTKSSNFGPRVDVAAPGAGILSTSPGRGYSFRSGTSMAAPHIAGVAALLLSINPGLTPQQIRDCLVNYADPISTDQPIGPRLNAFKALNACSGLPQITPSQTPPSPTEPPKSVQTSPTTGASSPLPTVKKSPTPRPVKKYTCRQATGANIPSGAIQIGALVCTPNP